MPKMRYKKLYVFGVVILLLFASILFFICIKPDKEHVNQQHSSDLNNTSDTQHAKWTVMMYLACDTPLRSNLINFYIDIMKNIETTDDFNLVTLIDGYVKDDTSYYYVKNDTLIPLQWHETESNMANPETFEKFLRLTIDKYPADHYALFTLSDFGCGWQGIFSDTNSGNRETLSLITMPQVSDVLKSITNNGAKKIDVYGIDVCIPDCVEVAYQIAPYVDYMVANQEHGYENFTSDEGFLIGWNYAYFLEELKDNLDMTSEQFAELITNSFRPGTYTSKFGKISAPKWYPITVFYVTLSTINLSKIDILRNTIDKFASNLSDNLKDIKSDIKKVRSETREYGKLYRRFWWLPSKICSILRLEPLSYDCFIDLYDFVEKLKDETSNQEIKNSCTQVMNALNVAIIANKALTTDPSHGISIYFPELKCQYDQSIWRSPLKKNFREIPSSYEDLMFTQDTHWDEFLKEYLRVRNK